LGGTDQATQGNPGLSVLGSRQFDAGNALGRRQGHPDFPDFLHPSGAAATQGFTVQQAHLQAGPPGAVRFARLDAQGSRQSDHLQQAARAGKRADLQEAQGGGLGDQAVSPMDAQARVGPGGDLLAFAVAIQVDLEGRPQGGGGLAQRVEGRALQVHLHQAFGRGGGVHVRFQQPSQKLVAGMSGIHAERRVRVLGGSQPGQSAQGRQPGRLPSRVRRDALGVRDRRAGAEVLGGEPGGVRRGGQRSRGLDGTGSPGQGQQEGEDQKQVASTHRGRPFGPGRQDPGPQGWGSGSMV